MHKLSASTYAFLTFLSALFFLNSTEARAQMFSVSSSSSPQAGSPLVMPSTIGPLLEFTDFSYYGPNGTEGPDASYNFNGVLYGASFESPFLSVFIADRTSLGDEENIRATRLGIGIRSPAVIAASPNYVISIPFGLNTDFTLVRTPSTSNTNEEFAQNAGYIAAGIDGIFRITDNILFQTVSTPNFGYTVGSYGSTGGISYKLRQDFRFSVIDIYRQYGLQAAYSFQFVRFNNSDTDFRYDWLSHSIRLAVTF
ncbi:MAG: hypothetical protein LAT84_13020 [Balneolia bacterium]|nr:hypothetical protein [Balneolia bacterium]